MAGNKPKETESSGTASRPELFVPSEPGSYTFEAQAPGEYPLMQVERVARSMITPDVRGSACCQNLQRNRWETGELLTGEIRHMYVQKGAHVSHSTSGLVQQPKSSLRGRRNQQAKELRTRA
jgi:hypothetical protein